ncbi:hypothetical protein CsSME_00025157 [Camellia sinensis var. sinensis]
MASSMSTATSSWPPRMYACGFGHCVVKIFRSAKNSGCAYYICPSPMRCVLWVGWCNEFCSERFAIDHPPNVVDIGLRVDVFT